MIIKDLFAHFRQLLDDLDVNDYLLEDYEQIEKYAEFGCYIQNYINNNGTDLDTDVLLKMGELGL